MKISATAVYTLRQIVTNLYKDFLHTENMSLYFKLTIIAIFHIPNLNHLYFKNIYALINIIFANKKSLSNFYFSANFSLNLKK